MCGDRAYNLTINGNWMSHKTGVSNAEVINVKLRPAWLTNAEVHLFDCAGRDLAAPTRTSDIAAGSLVWSQCSSGRRT